MYTHRIYLVILYGWNSMYASRNISKKKLMPLNLYYIVLYYIILYYSFYRYIEIC